MAEMLSWIRRGCWNAGHGSKAHGSMIVAKREVKRGVGFPYAVPLEVASAAALSAIRHRERGYPMVATHRTETGRLNSRA